MDNEQRVTIPSHDDDRVLRHVNLGETAYSLLLWDTHRKGRGIEAHKSVLGYALFHNASDEPIFSGEDYQVPGCIDDDDAVRGILGFLTLRKGDTDADYFDDYNERQLAFRDSDAEYLSMFAMEPNISIDADGLEIRESYGDLIDIDTCHGCGCDMRTQDHDDTCDRSDWNRTREGGSVL